MNKILFFTLSLVMAITAYGQNSASVDTLQTASDSTSVGSHAEFSAARQESNVTKAEGDSAYIRNDYASAIQIYENLLKKGEAAEVYYNLGNSYYKADDIARAILNYERALLLEPGNAGDCVLCTITRFVLSLFLFKTDYGKESGIYCRNSIPGSCYIE